MIIELEKCPFCGGSAKPSIRNTHRTQCIPSEYVRATKYIVQVICNKCHARGKPITFYSTLSSVWDIPRLQPLVQIEPWVKLAEECWNRRAGDVSTR